MPSTKCDGKPLDSESTAGNVPPELRRFAELAKKLVAVPKEEVDRLESERLPREQVDKEPAKA